MPGAPADGGELKGEACADAGAGAAAGGPPNCSVAKGDPPAGAGVDAPSCDFGVNRLVMLPPCGAAGGMPKGDGAVAPAGAAGGESAAMENMPGVAALAAGASAPRPREKGLAAGAGAASPWSWPLALGLALPLAPPPKPGAAAAKGLMGMLMPEADADAAGCAPGWDIWKGEPAGAPPACAPPMPKGEDAPGADAGAVPKGEAAAGPTEKGEADAGAAEKGDAAAAAVTKGDAGTPAANGDPGVANAAELPGGMPPPFPCPSRALAISAGSLAGGSATMRGSCGETGV